GAPYDGCAGPALRHRRSRLGGGGQLRRPGRARPGHGGQSPGRHALRPARRGRPALRRVRRHRARRGERIVHRQGRGAPPGAFRRPAPQRSGHRRGGPVSTFVLVHGAGHGAWCWERTERDLRAEGHTTVSVDLPLTSLADDAATVRACLDAVNEPAILVGHSYGGLVISEAAGGRSDVAQMVYVAAVMVGADESVLDLAGEYPPTLLIERMEYTPDGFMVFSPETAVACFYNESPPEAARAASLRMRPTAAVGMTASPGADPWRTV